MAATNTRSTILVGLLSIALLASYAGATGSWSTPVNQDVAGTGTGSGSGGGYNYIWSWSISGTKGSYNAAANATISSCAATFGTVSDSALHTAQGDVKQIILSWNPGPGGQCPCTHAAPTNAKISWNGSADVDGHVDGNANNCWPSSGSVDFLAYSDVSFTGLESDRCTVNLTGNFNESSTEISGTVSSDGDVEITISKTLSGDTYSSGPAANNVAVGGTSDPKNIAGDYLQAHGLVKVQAKCSNSAESATSTASTNINSCTVSKAYGGSYQCPNESQPHEGH